MSAVCHTDGFGIYLINDLGKQLIGIHEDDDKLSYAIEEGTVKVCRHAFAKNKHLELIEFPESLSQVEEDAFNNGPRDMHFISHSAAAAVDGDYLLDAGAHMVLFYTGNEAEIHIPSSVTVLGKQSFRGCSAETLILDAQIKEIHEDAFTTSHIERVFFTDSQSYVYFPKKDIRLRQHMLSGFGNNGIFDFERYDNDLTAGFMEDERMRMIAARLKWPLHLNQETEEKYRRIISSKLDAALQCVGQANDLFTLQLFFETEIINETNIEQVLASLHILKDLEAYAYAMDYQAHHFSSHEFDFKI